MDLNGGFLLLQLLIWRSLSASTASSSNGYPNVIFVILSQENSYHKNIAYKLKNDILDQAKVLGVTPAIHVLPDGKTHIGYWTVIPELPRFAKLYGSTSSWIYFCEESTVINLKQLLTKLWQLDPSEKLWMGYGLTDEEPSIIHHFAFAENPSVFKYPLFSAGFAISSALINDVVKKKSSCDDRDSEFSIDASHELALHMGVENPLRHKPAWFCDKKGKDCVSYPAKIKLCDPPVNIEEIYFAVKTCHKFHQNRVPIVKKTWGRYAKNIEFFSDLKNHTIPTTDVGVKNTEHGHCLKTLRILELALTEVTINLQHVKWVVLVDDDTILSVERLQSLLSCYKTDTVLGERYGYKVKGGRGYNYLTGGGGIAFGVETLHEIVFQCHCPQIDSPDDMVLGMCMTSHQVPITHSPLFHQARPMDYAQSYLDIGLPVSFHKHWNINPISVYMEWFASPKPEPLHTEL